MRLSVLKAMTTPSVIPSQNLALATPPSLAKAFKFTCNMAYTMEAVAIVFRVARKRPLSIPA